jgi:predicted transcriptional regulator
MMDDETKNELLGLTAEIVAAHVANNRVATNEVSDLIAQVHGALADLASPKPAEAPAPEPAVPVRSSVKQDYIVCLEDGKKLKMLKRYLRTNFDMSPDEYRSKWGLPRDYPMVAPAYAEQRRGLAQKIGLGRKRADEVAADPDVDLESQAEAVEAGVTDATPGNATDAKPARRTRGPAKKAEPAAAEDAAPKKRGRPRKAPVAA